MGIGIGLFAQAVYSDYKTTSGDELKSPTSSANTAARPRGNWKPKANETPPNHNNRSHASGGVWASGS